MNRREFIARTAGSAALVAIAACGDGVLSGPTRGEPRPIPKFTIKVSDFPGLATTGALVAVGNLTAAKRTGTATFTAYDMICTHQGCSTNLAGTQRFDCPCHGSSFDSDGQVIQGPAEAPLPVFPTSYDSATDILTIG